MECVDIKCKTDICKAAHQTQDCGIQSVLCRLTTFITFDSPPWLLPAPRAGKLRTWAAFLFSISTLHIITTFAQRSELCFINDGLRAAAECTLARPHPRAILATSLRGGLQIQNLFQLSEFLSHNLISFEYFSCYRGSNGTFRRIACGRTTAGTHT